MTEFMGLINGTYEAKQGGFVPGGASLGMLCHRQHLSSSACLPQEMCFPEGLHPFQDGRALIVQCVCVVMLS